MAEYFLVRRLSQRNNILSRQRQIRDASDPFQINESRFIGKFRLSKEAVRYLCAELRSHVDVAPNGLTLEIQVSFFFPIFPYFYNYNSSDFPKYFFSLTAETRIECSAMIVKLQ